MNREDIIRMAQEAGLWEIRHSVEMAIGGVGELERFAALVAFAEREAWERRYLRLQSLMDVRETQPNKPCCLAEREACAKVCEDSVEYAGDTLAKAIRARGDSK